MRARAKVTRSRTCGVINCGAASHMCWGPIVSAFFGLGGVVVASFLFYQGRKAAIDPGRAIWQKEARWHALCVVNIAFVELSEWLIWNHLPCPRGSMCDGESCPMGNIVGTYGVFLFGYSNWAWIVPLWAKRTAKVRGESDAKTHAMFFTFGVITFLGFWIRVLLSEYEVWNTRPVADNATMLEADEEVGWLEYRTPVVVKNVSSDTYTHIVKLAPTCSYPVDSAEMAPGNQHLNWQFAFYPLPWLPGAYAFFLTMFLPMVFYRPWQRSTAMAVWLAFTFVGPYLINPMSAMSLF